MANETFHIYPQFAKSLANGEVKLDGGKLKILLVGGVYTYSDNHQYLSSVKGELTGAGYDAGGAIIKDPTFTVMNNVGTLKGGNIIWEDLTMDNIRYGIIYDDAPNDKKPLIAYLDFGEAFNILNSNFEIIWSTRGIVEINIE